MRRVNMYHDEKRLLKPTNSEPHQTASTTTNDVYPLPAPIFYSPTKLQFNNSFDRFIPTRLGNNWQTTFSMISDSNRAGVVSKKTRENNGEGSRDGIAYSCLLKNELLGIVCFFFAPLTNMEVKFYPDIAKCTLYFL